MLLPAPISTNRMWSVSWKTRRVILTTAGRQWKEAARQIAREQWKREPLDGAVSVAITLHPRMNKDGSASKTRIDIDNAAKVALDTLQGVCYADDRQLEALIVTLGGPKPAGGLTVKVEAL